MAYDRTAVSIRERGFLDLLDLGLMVVRQWPLALGLSALAGIAPFAVLNALIARQALFADTAPDALLLPWFEAPLALAPMVVVLGGLMFGDRPSAGRVARTVLRAAPALIIMHVLLRALLFAVCFLYVLIPSRLAFVNEVILLERKPWHQVTSRNAALCAGEGTELFFQWLAQFVYGSVFVMCAWAGVSMIGHTLAGGELTWVQPEVAAARGFTFQLAYWVAIAFFGVVRFLMYIDQRIRREGWEVELRLKKEGRKMMGESQW